jgi:DNA-3-methyladenine glycosylase II
MDIKAALAHLNQDPKMAQVIAHVPMPDLSPTGRVYYHLLESIVSQQLSVKVADVIFGRFLQLFPDQQPHAESLINLSTEQLRGVGLSNQKAGYLQNVAHFSIENDLEHRDWSTLTDDEIIDFLSQIKGVGKWTVQMLLMFTLGRPDVFPIDDLGIQQGMARIFDLDASNLKDLKKRMLEIAEPWKPYRTIASRYIWRYKDSI